MKNPSILCRYSIVFIVISFLLGLSFIYPFTISNFNGDSDQYFSWVKDFYTNYGSYLSWTTAAGYNQFSIIHVFSILAGSISYKSPVLFFLIVNYSELILITVSSLIFVKLVNLYEKENNLIAWIYLLPVCTVIWTFLCLFSGTAPESQLLQATDLFIIFVDSFIIISIGWFLFLLNKLSTDKKLPKLNLSCFIVSQLYFSLTTLRFLSGGVLTEIALLICVLISSRRPASKLKMAKAKKNPEVYSGLSISLSKTSVTLLIVLGIVFIIGYYGFFMIEPYSTSARFVLRGGETDTTQAWNNAIAALTQYLTFTDLNPLITLLRIAYLIILVHGFKVFFSNVLFTKSFGFNLARTQLFSLLALINFVLVTLAGLFSHGTVFLDGPLISHYYELSTIFAFLSSISFILDRWKNIKHIRYTSLTSLFIFSIVSLAYVTLEKTPEFTTSKLLKCIYLNKDRYQLKNGMGDFWVVNPLMAQITDIRFSVIGSLATNLDYNWQRNLTQSVSNNNFLVYSNPEYKTNTLGLINSKIPSLNYQDIDCGNNSGVIVFDQPTTKYIDQFRSIEFNNSKSWFFLSNYATGQSLWGKMPWNQSFIKDHHEYFYYGSLLKRISKQAQYTINPDLAMTIDGNALSEQQPVVMTEMIHAGKGNYYVNSEYELTGSDANLLVINLTTQQPINNLTLTQRENSGKLNFTLDSTTPIAIAVVLSPRSKISIKNLTVGKLVD